MGCKATKAVGNPWYEARMDASKWDVKLNSRAGAAEVLGMSESSVADAELGATKIMPPDKAVVMADVYKAPQLLPMFCMSECPIGKRRSIPCELKRIDMAALQLITNMECGYKDDLLKIAYDGVVSDDEVEDFKDVMKRLNRIALSIGELGLVCDMADARKGLCQKELKKY